MSRDARGSLGMSSQAPPTPSHVPLQASREIGLPHVGVAGAELAEGRRGEPQELLAMLCAGRRPHGWQGQSVGSPIELWAAGRVAALSHGQLGGRSGIGVSQGVGASPAQQAGADRLHLEAGRLGTAGRAGGSQLGSGQAQRWVTQLGGWRGLQGLLPTDEAVDAEHPGMLCRRCCPSCVGVEDGAGELGAVAG